MVGLMFTTGSLRMASLVMPESILLAHDPHSHDAFLLPHSMPPRHSFEPADPELLFRELHRWDRAMLCGPPGQPRSSGAQLNQNDTAPVWVDAGSWQEQAGVYGAGG